MSLENHLLGLEGPSVSMTPNTQERRRLVMGCLGPKEDTGLGNRHLGSDLNDQIWLEIGN